MSESSRDLSPFDPANKPAPIPLRIVNTHVGETGTYYTLNIGVTVKRRSLPGLHQHFCRKCRAPNCVHVEYIRANVPDVAIDGAA